jgi:hypothetical protein
MASFSEDLGCIDLKAFPFVLEVSPAVADPEAFKTRLGDSHAATKDECGAGSSTRPITVSPWESFIGATPFDA